MALTHVELYEALKPSIGERAAAMIAEVVPPAGELATKADIAATRTDIAGLREDFAVFRGEIRIEMRSEHLRTMKWLVGVFVPMFAATWALQVGVIAKL